MFWRKKKAHPLDSTLFPWDNANSLTIRNLLAGGIHAFGRTDAGKSSSLVQIANAILRHGNSSMLVLCAKRGEYRDWQRLADRAGRSRDVIFVHPDQPWRFNMFGWESERQGEGAGIAQNVVRFLMEMRSVVFRESNQEGGESQQWKKQDERLLTHVVTILQFAGEAINPINIHNFILSAPDSLATLKTEAWQAGYCNQCIAKGFHTAKNPAQTADYMLARDYFAREWSRLAEKTRASIVVGTMATIFALTMGIVRELFAGETNFDPHTAIEGRKIVIVNMPPDEWGIDVGGVANIGLKYYWQKEILRREITDNSPLACIWGDESSLWVTPSDAHFLSRCRSYRGCMVYICQGLNNYREALPGAKADAAIEAMLANFGHKLFFALGDYATAEWASNLCGKELKQYAGGGVQHAPYETFLPFGAQSQYSSSFQEHLEHALPPWEFMNGLRTGSPANNYQVDAVLVRSGVPFSNGLPLLDVTFDQRRS